MLVFADMTIEIARNDDIVVRRYVTRLRVEQLLEVIIKSLGSFNGNMKTLSGDNSPKHIERISY